MSVQIQMRRGTAAQWATANTLLAEGEIGLELDTQKFKMGTGLLAWNDLAYYSAVGVSSVNGQTGTVVLDTDDVAEGAVNKYITTTEQSKLEGIEAGAEVNVNADWNAISGDSQILNKPTLGTAASTASTDYATAAQGALADSALQPAAIANMLETADIGVTVQGYSANTVVDASYVHTDNNYTTTEKSKLSGIEAGAEVNVNADWTAVTGDAVILNKPTLGTAAATASTDYATAAQGTKADSALQPAAIGVTVQAYDTDLTAWAGVATSAKQDTLVSGTNLKSINGTTLLGSGSITLFSGGLITVSVVTSLPGTPDANTLYIVTG